MGQSKKRITLDLLGANKEATYKPKYWRANLVGLILANLLACAAIAEPRVLLETSMGGIEIDLHPDVAPGHVQNFLNYVNDGDYNNSFIHRSVSGFIIQGGGFSFNESLFNYVPTDPPIENEFALSNVRGTVAMAKLGSDPDSATSQWFINLADNSANLDQQNGGFTVFATVVEGMDVVDAIASLPVTGIIGLEPLGSAVPLRNWTPPAAIVPQDNLVIISNAEQSTSFDIPMLPQPFFWLLATALGLAACSIGVKKTVRTRAQD